MVYDLQIPVAQLGLACHVGHDRGVLYLAHADDGGAVGCSLGLELRDGVGEVVHFKPILASVPLARAAGGKLFVASERVVGDSVEEILEVVECYAGDLHAAASG